MGHLKSIYFYFLILFQLLLAQLYGQQMPLQTFSLASYSFMSSNVDGLQMDWRLDLGLTNMSLDQSNSYHFTAGFLQPTIHRFANDEIWGKYNPSIELKNTFSGDGIILFSKEPDLILFGYKIMNVHGQVIASDQTTYRSGYLGRSIDISAMPGGVYLLQVLYLPESMTMDVKNNYGIKTIKFIKP
jgi:hypothetical protein